jgi:shikimate dehydrogenase
MRLFGLIGKTLKHSFSKSYFTKKFADEGLTDCRYETFELENIQQLPTLLQQQPQGFNITIPYKKEVLPYLHEANEIVREIGACNCVKVVDGKLYGFNTDVLGFQQSLQKRLQPYHQKALVLGTGGSSNAVQYALKQLGISYQLVSRQRGAGLITYEDLNEAILHDHHLIINTTPVGMFPNTDQAPPIPYQYLTDKHLLFDLIYNPEKTLFLQKGEAQGAAICNGYEMLILQAEASWDIWNKPVS